MKLCLGVLSSTEVILSDVQNDDHTVEINNDEVEEIDPEPFIPTHEWQVVKENQAIPAGLHVRMNFQTHVKEAKLMDEDESSNKKQLSDVNKNKETKSHAEGDQTESDQKRGPKIIIRNDGSHLHEYDSKEEKLYFTKSHLKQSLHEFRDKVGTKDIVDDITWSEVHHY